MKDGEVVSNAYEGVAYFNRKLPDEIKKKCEEILGFPIKELPNY